MARIYGSDNSRRSRLLRSKTRCVRGSAEPRTQRSGVSVDWCKKSKLPEILARHASGSSLQEFLRSHQDSCGRCDSPGDRCKSSCCRAKTLPVASRALSIAEGALAVVARPLAVAARTLEIAAKPLSAAQRVLPAAGSRRAAVARGLGAKTRVLRPAQRGREASARKRHFQPGDYCKPQRGGILPSIY